MCDGQSPLPLLLLRSIFFVVIVVNFVVIIAQSVRLQFISRSPLDESLIVSHQDFWIRHDSPIHPVEEFEFEQSQFSHTHTAYPCVSRIVPERVRQALCSNRSSGNQEAVNGEGIDGKFRIKSAEPVNVVDHGQEKRWRERGMSGQPMEIVSDRDARGGSRVKPR